MGTDRLFSAIDNSGYEELTFITELSRERWPERISVRRSSGDTSDAMINSVYSQSSTFLVLAQVKRRPSNIVGQAMMPHTRWPGSASSSRIQFI
jgi:hypothetical protein